MVNLDYELPNNNIPLTRIETLTVHRYYVWLLYVYNAKTLVLIMAFRVLLRVRNVHCISKGPLVKEFLYVECLPFPSTWWCATDFMVNELSELVWLSSYIKTWDNSTYNPFYGNARKPFDESSLSNRWGYLDSGWVFYLRQGTHISM